MAVINKKYCCPLNLFLQFLTVSVSLFTELAAVIAIVISFGSLLWAKKMNKKSVKIKQRKAAKEGIEVTNTVSTYLKRFKSCQHLIFNAKISFAIL